MTGFLQNKTICVNVLLCATSRQVLLLCKSFVVPEQNPSTRLGRFSADTPASTWSVLLSQSKNDGWAFIFYCWWLSPLRLFCARSVWGQPALVVALCDIYYKTIHHFIPAAKRTKDLHWNGSRKTVINRTRGWSNGTDHNGRQRHGEGFC